MPQHATGADFEDLLRRALERTEDPARWTTDTDETWCRLALPSVPPRAQGWKLHVSATPASAPEVLVRALDVLLRDRSPFKFARSAERVGVLNSRAAPRGGSGKFITVYPRTDEDAARIARELHETTTGLPGPRILSDRPYTPDSLVHYRYGAFVGRRRLSEDGLLVWYIEDPDGNPVEDKRTGQYAPPAWARSPFPDTTATPAPPARPDGAANRSVVLGGRFAVKEAIRHTNKGGVYRGTDLTTGAPVIVKEARPHVEADADGRDVRDGLRAEARTLERLGGTDLAPALLAVFEHAGHLFLAEEEIPGVTLRTWVAEHFRDVGAARYRQDALAHARRLVDLLAAAHARGCVLRDLTPANIMVRPDGELRLIDLELAVLTGDEARPTTVGTPGFSAPERLDLAPVAPSADHYSLGAALCFTLTGKVPQFLPERPADRRGPEHRLADWLHACHEALALPEAFADTVLALMRDDPTRRHGPAEARRALRPADRAHPAPTTSPRHTPPRTPIRDAVDATIAGIVEHLVDSMDPTDEHRLWPVSTAVGETDPTTVQQGAAGVLAVLTRRLERTDDPRLAKTVSTAAHWIAARTDTRSIRPGLHFGGLGTAWALHDAGRALDDTALTAHALALALAPQEDTVHHDITHGHAGSGLAAAHLWRRTGDPRLARLVEDRADRLAAGARRDGPSVGWPVPAEALSAAADKRYLGYAHGTAGIGTFLLAARAVSHRREHLDLAVAAGETLLADVLMIDGAAHWPAQSGDPATAAYWCHGSAGIGSFLIRLWQATGDDRFGDLARHAARAVVERASRAPLTQCHGLAGNGDFLLDLAAATGDPAHHTAAEDLARLILAERAEREGHVVFPNEYGDVSTSWSDGSAGILAFLSRIHHPDPRHWMFR
ncbi:class IV lanthionine synthetase LanL (plasmid) [Streptomyces sp. BI20]|uniref:class IV lanthionine synthetase LanL n=1 Tax=Streptomyces sp. BI20 TaxID=3403460 RepID=UPI003C729B54